jgi:hypothetical protein
MNKFRIGVKMKDHSDKSKKEVSDILIKYFKEQVGDKPYKIVFEKYDCDTKYGGAIKEL